MNNVKWYGLDCVFNRLRQADYTCSDIVLGPEEVRVFVDDFDDVNNELIEIKRIIEGFDGYED